MKATIRSTFSRDNKLWHEAVSENSLRLNFICPEGGPLKIGDVIWVATDLLDQEQVATVYSASKTVKITIDGRYIKDLAVLEKADPEPVSKERLKGAPANFDRNTLLLTAQQWVLDVPSAGVKKEGFKLSQMQDAVSFTFVKPGEGRHLIIIDKQTGELILRNWYPENPSSKPGGA